MARQYADVTQFDVDGVQWRIGAHARMKEHPEVKGVIARITIPLIDPEGNTIATMDAWASDWTEAGQ